jgi:pantoate--beta-alanine ligase
MSSRNRYLSRDAREQARVLNAALHEARSLVREGERDAAYVVEQARTRIEKEPLASVQYVEVVDPADLTPLERITGPALLAVCARFESTRLIDNTLLETS